MVTKLNYESQVWTDLNSPTKKELDSLIESENLDPRITKDLLSPTPKQHVEIFGDTVYAVLHFPSFTHKKKEYKEQEVDFIIGKNSLVTARYDSIDAIHHFIKQVEVNQTLNRGENVHLFFGVMKEVYRFLFNEVDYLKDWMRDIEDQIFNGREKQMVFSISSAGRNLLGFKRTIVPHDGFWRDLADMGETKFGPDFKKECLLMLEECRRLWAEIDNLSLMLVEMRETNNSILSTKQNEIMKIFTILAFVTFPLSLVAAIFGMNTSFIPIVGLTNDFWIVIGLMILMSLAMFSFFKYKRWI